MMKVKVEGITQKGKNRINEHGDIWSVVKENGFDLLLESDKGYLKWHEPDFRIVEEINND